MIKYSPLSWLTHEIEKKLKKLKKKENFLMKCYKKK